MADEREPCFPCYPSKWLGALAGMKPDVGYVYWIVCLRIYETGKPCDDSLDALARRTGLSRRRVSDALELLFSSGKLVPQDGGIMNPFAEEILLGETALQKSRSDAGEKGANGRWKKTKENQSNADGNRIGLPSGCHQPEDGGLLLTSLKLDSVGKEVSKKVPRKMVDDWPSDYLEKFWTAFPPYRREAKRKVGEKLDRLQRGGLSWAVLFSGVERYAKSDPGQYAQAPLAWLNGEKWDREYGAINGNGNSSHRTDPVAGRATAREANHVAAMGTAALRFLEEGQSTRKGRTPPGGLGVADELDLKS